MPVVAILFGAILTVAAVYAWGLILLRKLPAPPEVALAVGAVLGSFLVFLVLLLHGATWPVLLTLALVPLAACAVLKIRPSHPAAEAFVPPSAALVLLPYALWYLVNALAPETQPDGLTYHLGLPYQYLRLHGFADRVSFYNVLPQGMEMLYTMAFAFGRHSAAKLVSLAFFFATVPLLFRIGRRLGLTDVGCLLAAAFYFTAPVSGVTGSSSYNDASLVFFTLAAFYLLLLWDETNDWRYLPLAGLAAGFCYAIKMPGAATVLGAGVFVLARRRPRALAALAAVAVAVAAPWIVRAAVLTGNPFAPLMNALFRNPYFHLVTERILSANLASLGRVPPLEVPWQLALGDGLVGTFGPLLLILPLALLAWRNRTVRLCLVAALIVGSPWIANKGARFLMPAVGFAALALGKALPRRAAWAALVLQVVVCWPQALNLWQPDYTFRLHSFPWKAALRIQPETDYLAASLSEYRVARMVEKNTPPQARIFAFGGVANAYLARDVSVSWQSAEGDSVFNTLWRATVYGREALYRWKAAWEPQYLTALRFRLSMSYPGEWDIAEVELYDGGTRVRSHPEWTLRAKPNRWDMPLAFDGNPATYWRSWEPMRAGMYTEVDFDQPQQLSAAWVLSHTPLYNVPLEVYGKQVTGQWRLLSGAPLVDIRPEEDLRLEATTALRSAGFRYLLVPVDHQGNGLIGAQIEQDPLNWDLEPVAREESHVLFRVR